MVVKIVRSMSVDPEVLRRVVEKAQFYGFRSTSDLVNFLLKKWIESPERKN